MFDIVNSVYIDDVVHIDLLDYHTKQEFTTIVEDPDELEEIVPLIESVINNECENIFINFYYINENEVLMKIFDIDISDYAYELFFISKTTVDENPSKNVLNNNSNSKEKYSEEEIINMDHKQKIHNELNNLKELNKLIHPGLSSDNEEECIKPIVPASTNTDEINKFKNEIAELKNYLTGLQDFVPKVVLGIFNDYKITKQKNPHDTHSTIVKHKLIDSKIIEFPINVKEISMPLGQDPNNKLHYDNINLNKLEQFYNLENLIIPSCVFFKEKQFTIPNNSINIQFSEIIKQHYGNLAVAGMYSGNPSYNVSDINLPKLKQLELIGCPKKGVFCFLQPQLEKIIINEHNFDYKLPSNLKSIDEVKIDISEFRLNFICPIIFDTSNELDIVLRTQCPKLKLIEFNFYSKSELSSKYLKKLKKDFSYYYDEEYFTRYGLKVKINIY